MNVQKTLRCKSSEVQAVCRAQQQQILEQQAREKDLQRYAPFACVDLIRLPVEFLLKRAYADGAKRRSNASLSSSWS